MLESLFKRSSPPELLLGKNILNIYSKFTGEHPWQSMISIKLQSSFDKYDSYYKVPELQRRIKNPLEHL